MAKSILISNTTSKKVMKKVLIWTPVLIVTTRRRMRAMKNRQIIISIHIPISIFTKRCSKIKLEPKPTKIPSWKTLIYSKEKLFLILDAEQESWVSLPQKQEPPTFTLLITQILPITPQKLSKKTAYRQKSQLSREKLRKLSFQ